MRRRVEAAAGALLLAAFCGAVPGLAASPLIDPLDGRPLGWRLIEADGMAEVRAHWLDATGGVDRRPCEAMTLVTGHGTRAILEYRIDPSQVIEEVRATVMVHAVRRGVRVGMRMRYPRVIDPTTRAPLASTVWGETHRGSGEWETLAATADPSQRRLREMAIRGEFGTAVDLGDAYIDAVVINAYTGPGTSTLRLDNLRVDGLVSMSPAAAGPAAASAAASAGPSRNTAARAAAQNSQPYSQLYSSDLPYNPSAVESAFPNGRITRVLEYNGEPLDYLKMLGFDAVLLSRPPTAEQLREAVRHAITIYAPPPTAPVPELEPLLAPVAGWYLGTSLDDSQLQLAADEAKRIDRMPQLWRRPALAAPAESWDRFAGVATTLVYDLPPAARGLGSGEQVQLLQDQLHRTGRPVAAAIGVATLPPQRLTDQLDMISHGVGAPQIEDYGWHAIWLQVADAVKVGPRAIVFRSTRSLTSGREADLQRGAVLGMVNRWLDIVGPAASGSQWRSSPASSRPDYHLAHLSGDGVQLIVATQLPQVAGDSAAAAAPPLEFELPTSTAAFAWRLSDTAAEQLPITGDRATAKVSIASPDWVEWIVMSDDAGVGRLLQRAIARHAANLNQERWQLASDDLLRGREDWRSAVAVGLVPRAAVPSEALRVAASAMAEVQPIIAGGRFDTAMRTTRGADRLAVESRSTLARRLHPPAVHPTGLPTLLAPGGTMLQLVWRPILDDGGWSNNLLAGGELDDAETMIRSGWSHQKRLESVADAFVGVDPAAGSDGGGALRVAAAARGEVPLPGGYAGTVIRVRSGGVTLSPGSWVRIEARVRTLGFGGPHQGLLIYDSDAGSELGTLVRGDQGWQTVRLYRAVTTDRPLHVTFEALGGGEAMVDWVRLSMWQREPAQPLPLRPLVSLPAAR